VESIHGRSNGSQPRLPLHMHAEDNIPTFLTSNIYIGICLPKSLTLTRLRSYEMFEVLLNVGINKAWAFREFSTFACYKRRFCTGWREGFLSRREFRTLYNPRSELHPLIFAEQFSRWKYHSMHDFHPVRYTAMVNNYSNRHTGYKQS